VTKRIYGQKRTKKPEPPLSNADIRDRDNLDDQQQKENPPAKGDQEPALSKREKKRLKREQAHDQITCQMGTIHRLWRVLGFILMMGLNIGIIGGDIWGGRAYVRLSWQREAVSLIMLVIFNALVLFPILFEAWYAKVDKDGITLAGMFWRISRSWDKVTDFKNPVFLKLAMMRLGRFLFFINKRVLPDYAILESLILRYWRSPKSKV
jgi:hypothetical protein